MNTTSINLQRLNDAIADGRLTQGTWGDDADQNFKYRVCALSAVVPGATNTTDACPVLGVPVDILELVISIYDGVRDFKAFALEFFDRDLTDPRIDWRRVADQFSLATMKRLASPSEHVTAVSALLTRSLAGEAVEPLLDAAAPKAYRDDRAKERSVCLAAWGAARHWPATVANQCAYAHVTDNARAAERDRQRQDFINILNA